MKAAIFNPYLDTLGGGERYTMAVASVLSDNNYDVYIQWYDPEIIKKLESRFGIKLNKVKVIEDIKRGDGYDVCFWLSDGSIPALKARINLLHFQIPFKDVSGDSLLNRMKLFRINKVICNSYFTKEIIDAEFKVNSIVVYPPVAVSQIKQMRKENVILSVGRFSQLTQAKRQDVLIEVFKDLYDGGLKNWKLVFAGGSEIGAEEYVAGLRQLAEGYPISIIESPGFTQLKELYGKAKVFWSASGYGIDEKLRPKAVEHFGIVVVEAMAAGAIPVIFNAGGHREIIEDGYNGYLWQKKSELKNKTLEIINNNSLQKNLSVQVKKDSWIYGYDRFYAEIESIL